MRSERQKNPMFSDSVLSRWFFNPGENFYQFNPDELREQMQELQEEFRKFREEMNNWKNEVRTTEEIRK